jgi:hypothetical protein
VEGLDFASVCDAELMGFAESRIMRLTLVTEIPVSSEMAFLDRPSE